MRPDPDRARAWLESELSRPEYHQQSLLERVLGWLDDRWDRLTAMAAGADELSTTVALALALGALALALVVVPRVRRTPKAATAERGVLRPGRVTADEHRAQAEAALGEGRFSDAVVEAMRALARRMVDRGVLDETPGSTAHEIAFALAEVFPDQQERLNDAAVVFDAVQYGDVAASREQASGLLRLHDELRVARADARGRAGATAAVAPR